MAEEVLKPRKASDSAHPKPAAVPNSVIVCSFQSIKSDKLSPEPETRLSRTPVIAASPVSLPSNRSTSDQLAVRRSLTAECCHDSVLTAMRRVMLFKSVSKM